MIVDDWCFIAAGIMSSHTKNIDHGRPRAPKRQLITRYGYGSVIGSRTNTSAGVTIAPGAIVGYGSHVVVDLDVPNAVYYNKPNPGPSCSSSSTPTTRPTSRSQPRTCRTSSTPELLAKYLPHYRP